ncbi:hypothetical protein Gotur_010152 [Gossypium turneri]
MARSLIRLDNKHISVNQLQMSPGLLRSFGCSFGDNLRRSDRNDLLRNNFAELIIGGILMPDKSRNLVYLRWLLKLVDFRGVGELSQGSAMLVTLC